MIEAIVFDLDGTLVQTEELKAKSYALAAAELAAGRVREAEVMEKFREFVGLDRERISKQLLEDFNLEEPARSRMRELGVDAPWKAYAELRSRRYEEMLKNEDLIRQNAYPDCLALLRSVR